jgi:hypothetical protein
MNLFSDSIQSMEELLRKSKKVKCSATLEEADIAGVWLTAYTRIKCSAARTNVVVIVMSTITVV